MSRKDQEKGITHVQIDGLVRKIKLYSFFHKIIFFHLPSHAFYRCVKLCKRFWQFSPAVLGIMEC